MAPSSRAFVATERAGLADLFDELGPGAPPCCAVWTTARLAAHLVVRDRRPDGLPGYGAGELGVGTPLASWSDRLEDRVRGAAAHGGAGARVRSGPPAWSPFAWPVLAQPFNTTELAIHHEDVRRAQPEWAPRDLPRRVQDQLWTIAALLGRRAAGRRGLVLRRSDAPGAEKRFGAGGRTVEGEPMGVLPWTSGRRDVARVTVS